MIARMPGPLSGVRVLDLSRVLAGPYCSMLLADLGADVVKVERVGRGDDSRSWAPPHWDSESVTFLALNRNKRSLALDYKDPRGRRVDVLYLPPGRDRLACRRCCEPQAWRVRRSTGWWPSERSRDP